MPLYATVKYEIRVGGYEYELWLNASEYSRLSVFGRCGDSFGVEISFKDSVYWQRF